MVDPRFTSYTIDIGLPELNHPWRVHASDLNGDGYLDAIVVSSFNRDVLWYSNDGTGSFTLEQTLDALSGLSQVQASDVDGDGDVDLVASLSHSASVLWYNNVDGQGFFSSYVFITSSTNSANLLATGDIDGDGDADVVVVGRDNSEIQRKVMWFENTDGQGNFGTENVILDSLTEDSIAAVAVFDMDNDGDLDVLTGGTGGVRYFANTDGQGNFSPIQVISSLETRFVSAADMDNDGDVDILAGGDDYVEWIANTNGNGNFATVGTAVATDTRLAWSVAAADVDLDGDMDVLVSDRRLYNVLWYLNNGAGDFTTSPETIYVHIGVESLSSIPADLNNDGYLDVLYSMTIRDELAWAENECGGKQRKGK